MAAFFKLAAVVCLWVGSSLLSQFLLDPHEFPYVLHLAVLNNASLAVIALFEPRRWA